MENTIINEANQALTQLSRDPEAQRLARWREDQLRLYRVEMTAAQRTARQKGLEEGLEKGLEKGREEGLEKGQLAGRQSEAREVIRALCKAFDIEWVDGYEEHIQSATLDQLGLLREHILKLRNWPD